MQVIMLLEWLKNKWVCELKLLYIQYTSMRRQDGENEGYVIQPVKIPLLQQNGMETLGYHHIDTFCSTK